MFFMYMVTAVLVLISFFFSREKTFTSFRIALKKIISILPAFLMMLILVSILLYAVPDHTITYYLGSTNKYTGIIVATIFGSLTLMPGFIAFPLSGLLLTKGVSYTVISAFTTTLMMVGVLTYPVEKEYFGHNVAVVRNLISLVIALIVAFVTGIFFGEVF